MTIDFVSDQIGARLQRTCLFYPCSGEDLTQPVKLFAPYVKRFWFADIGYFHVAGSVHNAEPALTRAQGYDFVSAEICENVIPESEWIDDAKYRGVGPCIRAETFRHRQSGQPIVVQRCRRRGPAALRSLTEPLGVFFYRGDSQEGGSGTLWLTVPRHGRSANVFLEVLDRLVDGGLIVTDGSNCLSEYGHVENLYRPFADVAEGWRRDSEGFQGFSFRDAKGRCFRLLGCVSSRWDQPTLMWQMSLWSGITT